MDKRYLIFFALALPIYIGTMIYVQKTQEKYTQSAPREQNTGNSAGQREVVSSPSNEGEEPRLAPAGEPVERQRPEPEISLRRPIDLPPEIVRTGFFEVHISPVGAVPVRWDILLDQGEENEVERVALIDVALDPNGLDRPLELILKEKNTTLYYNELNYKPYTLVSRKVSGASITLVFESPLTSSGLRLTKTYVFPHEGYQTRLILGFMNEGESRLAFDELGIAVGPGLGYAPDQTGGFAARYSYTRPFFRTPDDIEDVRLKEPGVWKPILYSSQWAGLVNQYFMMCLIPDPSSLAGEGFSRAQAQLYDPLIEENLIGQDELNYYPKLELYGGKGFSIEPGRRVEFAYTIFAGPKEDAVLRESGLGLERIQFYESFPLTRFLCFVLMAMLNFFYGLMKSWGLAIIALVITVRIIIFPLAQIQLRQQAKMMAQQAKLKPYLDKLNAKYKDNPTKRNQEMMKLYREHNVNPFGMLKGCLWIIIQIPIFIGMFRLLGQSFDLRGSSFLWIADLSQPDHLFPLGFTLPFFGDYFNLLPILWAAAQLVVSKLSVMPTADPNQQAMQKQMMYMMPVMMLVFFYPMPSGLVLYWLISTIWQLFQQQIVNKKILRPPPAAATAAA